MTMSDSEPRLPDKVVSIDFLRIAHGAGKTCKCGDFRFDLDPASRKAFCRGCGAEVEPFEALHRLCRHYERINEDQQRLLEQRNEIQNYKPWLIELRELERMSQRGKMLPTCPHCHKPMTFRDIHYGVWVNAESPELAAKHAQKVLNGLKGGSVDE